MIGIGSTWTTNRTRCTGTEQSDEYLVLGIWPEEATREGIGSPEVALEFPV
jgi:hypothetical protein